MSISRMFSFHAYNKVWKRFAGSVEGIQIKYTSTTWLPKVKGGRHKGTVECCRTCSKQIHILFSESELAKITLEELIQTEVMKKYLEWIRQRRGDFKVRLSRRLREKR